MAHGEGGVRTEDLKVTWRTAVRCARGTGSVVTEKEVVLDEDPFDRTLLVLDEKPLAAVVMQVVSAVHEVVPDPHRLQAVAVVAVLPDVGELVSGNKRADAIAVRVVVAIETDRVLPKGADKLVADDRDVIDGVVVVGPASTPR